MNGGGSMRALEVARLFSRHARQQAEAGLARALRAEHEARAAVDAAARALAAAREARTAPRETSDVRRFDDERRARARRVDLAQSALDRARHSATAASDAVVAARSELAGRFARDEAIGRTIERRRALERLRRRRALDAGDTIGG